MLSGVLGVAKKMMNDARVIEQSNNLLCYKCGNYSISIRIPISEDAVIQNGIRQLNNQLEIINMLN